MTVSIPLSQRSRKNKGKYEALISDEDRDLAELKWSFQRGKNTIYVKRSELTREQTYLHRVVLARMLGRELEKHEKPDHIDGNGLNNQRHNLRLANHSQNLANSRRHRDSTSGYKGVSWDKRVRKWQAQINHNHKSYYLGAFDDPEKAHEAYLKKAKELYGDFANSGDID
jgi:hypothetical protein